MKRIKIKMNVIFSPCCAFATRGLSEMKLVAIQVSFVLRQVPEEEGRGWFC